MIYITGDLHGELTRLGSRYFDGGEEDFVIVCGDFGGLWDGSEEDIEKLSWLDSKPFTTLFVDGNHENFDLLEGLPVSEWHGGKARIIGNHVIHLMRGEIYDIAGYSFFCMGGASCHDIQDGVLDPDEPDFMRRLVWLTKQDARFRIRGVSWWERELPDEHELALGLENLARRSNTVDYIITHCAPTPIQQQVGGDGYTPDRLTDYLEQVRATVNFRRWFFGHYHRNADLGESFTLLYDGMACIDGGGVSLQPQAYRHAQWEQRTLRFT